MSRPSGLRERKKQKTRLAISEVATRLFIAQGFDQVTVAQVAEAAEVSVNTVFNYFAAKEDLMFDRAEELELGLAQVVRNRRAGESALDALERSFLRAARSGTGPFLARNIRAFMATIEASPALQARARLSLEYAEQHLAKALAEETGAKAQDPSPRIVAALVLGLVRLLVQEFSQRVHRGEGDATYRPALARLARSGFAQLRAGLGAYPNQTSAAKRRG